LNYARRPLNRLQDSIGFAPLQRATGHQPEIEHRARYLISG